MNARKYIEKEQKAMQKLMNFRLPRKFMYYGLTIAALSIIMMFVRAFLLEGDTLMLKEVLKKTLLVGMLIMSLSEDKEEDELTIKLRMQSYAWAFVIGVIYALIMPYVEYGVSNAVNSGGEAYKDLGDFQVLLFMLMIQLMFYHTLKRYR
jgi:hypothetical protein